MKKTLFILATLLMTSYCMADDVVVGNHAKRDKNIQQQGVVTNNYQFQQGDTIIISTETKTYLTGEEISNWVYYVRHIVQQNGGKRFPNGILIQGINSWVDPSGLMLMHGVEQTPAAIERQHQDQQRIERQQGTTATPAQPVVRDEVVTPVQPVVSQEVVTPAQPVVNQEVVTPAQPVVSQEVVTPAQPVVREEVVTPAQPVVSQEVVTPAQPVVSQEVVTPAQPVVSQEVVTPAQPVVVAPVVEQTTTEETVAVEETATESDDRGVLSNIDRFSIGLRGGVASMMHKTVSEANGSWKPGFDVLLDLQYAHYWQRGTNPSFGILTGVSVGYDRSVVTSSFSKTTPLVADADGDMVQYILKGDAVEADGQILAEIPVMFSMITNDGLFLNVGPRIQIPVFNHYQQILYNGDITLYNQTRNISISNEAATGELAPEQLVMNGRQEMSKLNVTLSAELGYEWKLQNNNAIGLGVYANYGLFSIYNNTPVKELFQVTLPTAGANATVDAFTTTKAYTDNNGLGFFDCGVKFNYSFDWIRR